jgi:Plant mobile domain
MTIMGDCQLDKSLMTALVERWRPETSTFHLPVGELTVTLEDVLSMEITYQRYFKFLICYFIFFWKSTNLIL